MKLKRRLKKESLVHLAVAVVWLFLTGWGANLVIAAWQGPTADAPEENVDMPLNVSGDLQRKLGGLDIKELFFQGEKAEIDFDSGASALVFDATNNGDWDIQLYENGLYIGAGEDLYLRGGAIFDRNDNQVNIGEGLGVAGRIDATGDVCTALGGGICLSSLAGAGSGAPRDASYLVVNLNGTLTGERRIRGGAGINLSDGGANSNLTISADTSYLQRRVTGTCAPGSSIRIIRSDGTVVCETDDTGSGGGMPNAGNGLYYSGSTLHVGAGTGISVSSDSVRVKNTSFSCNAGYSLRSINIDTGAKVCEYDDTGSGGGGSLVCNTYSACAGGVLLDGKSVYCSSGEILTGGGCKCGTVKRSRPTSDNRGWECRCANMGCVYARCCKIQ